MLLRPRRSIVDVDAEVLRSRAMITQACLLHEPKRSKPWVVRWYGEPDWNTGKQRRYGRSFRHSREAKAFLAEKQSGLDDGAPRDPPQNVTLGRLIAEFEEARLATLSFASQQAYRNTIAQLVEYFGRLRAIRCLCRRHAEAFLAGRTRRDGRPGELSSWSHYHHRKHCRGIFGAAVEWGYIAENPFVPATNFKTSTVPHRNHNTCQVRI